MDLVLLVSCHLLKLEQIMGQILTKPEIKNSEKCNIMSHKYID